MKAKAHNAPAVASANDVSKSEEPAIAVRSFKASILLICGVVFAAILIQKLEPNFSAPFAAGTIVSILLLAALFVFAIPFRTKLYQALTSYHFAISILSAILLATAAGTVILQRVEAVQFLRHYGASGRFLQTFFLDDIFHSFWFYGLLALLSLSMLLILFRRKAFRVSQIGFLASHLGVIAVLAGGLIGLIYGEKGFVNLEQGKSVQEMVILEKGYVTDETKTFGFTVRLDEFQVEFYENDFKIYAYRYNPDKKNYLAVGSFKIQEGDASYRVPSSSISFRIRDFDLSGQTKAPFVNVRIDSKEGMQDVALRYHPDGLLYLEGGEIVMLVDQQDPEPKRYRSLVSIWENGRRVKSAPIEVNQPLTHGGYSFYQSNYDPKNLKYSGLMVVRDPGLYVVYAGLISMCAGITYIFYGRTRSGRRR